jgi:hypothetical protein
VDISLIVQQIAAPRGYIYMDLMTKRRLIVFKASLKRRLSVRAHREDKASRRLEIRRKATVAATKKLEERGGDGREELIRRRRLGIWLR